MNPGTGDGLRDDALRAAFADVASPRDAAPPARAAPPAPAADAGLVAGRYRVREEIGRGGQGAVYLADDLTLGRSVALKMLTGFGVLSDEMRQRFEREAQLASRLHHPGLCAVHDFGVRDGVPFIAMQHVEGRTLASRIRAASGAAPAREAGKSSTGPSTSPDAATSRAPATLPDVLWAAHLVEKTARALQVAHEAGVIHRDIKPGNIMVTPAGEPVILDFGLARETDSGEPSLTRDGELFGTPAYMSPEQLLGKPVRLDARSDVYSLGVTLYETLTLRRPFDAATREVLYRRILDENPPDPRRLNPSVPRDLAIVVATAMDKVRHRRYQSAAAFADDLRRVLSRQPILAKPVGRWTRLVRWTQRNPMLAATTAAAALILAAGAAVSGALALRAREHLGAYNRLADARRLDDLLREEAELWPATSETAGGIDAWLRRAHILADALPGHRAELEDLRRQARPRSEAESARDRASHRSEVQKLAALEADRDDLSAALVALEAAPIPEARKEKRREELEVLAEDAEGRLDDERARLEPVLSERLTWSFDDDALTWRHEKLAALVRGLGELCANAPAEPGIRGMEARLEFARTLRRRTIDDRREGWDACRRRIAANARYAGLDLAPQEGLVPLGPDPASGLEEFCETATGTIPERDPRSGRLTPAEPMALVFVLIPGGTFTMGAQASHPDGPNYDPGARQEETPLLPVALAPFFLSKYEMTQGQWLRATGRNPSHWNEEAKVPGRTPSLLDPVEQVSWETATTVLARLGLCLPTEARWEYACRAGTTTPWGCGAEPSSLEGAANLADMATHLRSGDVSIDCESWDDGHPMHAPVGSFAANAFGMHDMSGNVFEPCADGYGSYSRRPRAGDGLRVYPAARDRVCRGGSSVCRAPLARAAFRARTLPWSEDGQAGVRPARDLR